MATVLKNVTTHHDVPTTNISDYQDFTPTIDPGITKYQAPLPGGTNLDALLINKQSDVLVVALHGATNRVKKSLPRFEWMRTLRETDYNSLYFSDPCLALDDKLQLAWYTGWKQLDLYPILANWITTTATAIGASKILLLGSSGGGLAALQISPYIPGSMALPFSCQTSISGYLVQGTRHTAQRDYLRAVMPHLTPAVPLEDLSDAVDWAEPLGARLSAVKRYETEQPNYVYYVQNTRDYPHVEQHYLPFRKVIEASPNTDRVRFVNYKGPENHNPPTADVFQDHLGKAIDWFRTL